LEGNLFGTGLPAGAGSLRGFLDWGIERGDRIGILSENRWEWAVTDFAVLAIGAVDVPIYPTLTSEQIGELLHDSGCAVAWFRRGLMYDKVAAAVRGETALEHVVMMDSSQCRRMR
jgi:long-chain acyl-CoA synthetase